MHNNRKYIVSMLVFLAMFLATCIVLLKNCDFSDMAQTIAMTDIKYLLLAVGMLLLFIFFAAECIRVILDSLREKRGRLSCGRYACIELYFSAVTPSSTGGQPAQAYYMAREGIPMAKSTVALLLIAVMYKLVLVILGVLVALFMRPLIFPGHRIVMALFTFGMLFNVVLIVVCLMLMFSRSMLYQLVVRCIRFLVRIRLMRHPDKKIAAFEKYMHSYRKSAGYIREHFGVSVKVFIFTMLQRVAQFSIAYFVYRSLGFSEFGYAELMAVQVAIALAVDSLPLPGGVGAAESTFLLLYAPVYPGGMLMPALVLTRGISFYSYLIICGIVSMWTQLKHAARQRKSKGNEI